VTAQTVPELVSAAADAAIQLAAAKRRFDAYKAAAIAAADRAVTADGARSFLSDIGLGELRRDNVGKPAQPRVTNRNALAEWLADPGHAPDQVTTTITVPVDQLVDALAALEFAGIDKVSADVHLVGGVEGWIDDHTVLVARDVPEGTTPVWDAVWVGPDKTQEALPGVEGTRPVEYWVLTPDAKRREAAEAEADAEVAAELAPAADLEEPADERIPA
jgi:hypothetical protein